jgi:hypothetical protein
MNPSSSPVDNLNLLKILNGSLINTIQQIITQHGRGDAEFVSRSLAYIQILLIQLQNLVFVFNRLGNRLGKIEKNLKIYRNNTLVTSQQDLEALRKQLDELMHLPSANVARNRANTGGGGKRKTRGMPRRRKNSSAKTRRRNTKSTR